MVLFFIVTVMSGLEHRLQPVARVPLLPLVSGTPPDLEEDYISDLKNRKSR